MGIVGWDIPYEDAKEQEQEDEAYWAEHELREQLWHDRDE